MTPDEAALAEIALRLAEQAQTLERSLEVALLQLAEDLATDEVATALPAVLDSELQSALMAMPTFPERAAFVVDYASLNTMEPSRSALRDLVTAHFAGPSLHRLLGLIDTLTEAEIAAVFDQANSDTRQFEALFEGSFDISVYACQEDRPDNSIEGVLAVNAALTVPIMAIGTEEAARGLFAFCENFETHPRDEFHDPVESDIPTLLLTGLNDTQTAASWGPLAAETLENGTALVFPEAGHGVLQFSDCAVDIGIAFIEDPEAPLDTRCIEPLRPTFTLPPPPPEATP